MPTTPSASFEPSLGRLDPVFNPGFAKVLGIQLVAPTSGTTVFTKGTIMAEYANSLSLGIYAGYSSSGAVSIGLNVPKGILQYTVTVDSGSNVTLAGEFGQTQKGCPMYMPGMAVWKCADLIGLDSNAITAMGGSLVEGTTAAGLVRL